MTEFNFSTMISQENQVKQIPIDMLVPYHNHQFTLYQGERLDDMVESVKNNGIITPIICRPCAENKYEILVGHNRWNAAKRAELAAVPAIIKEHLTDEEAEVYVIESNLIQRGFNDLKISEQAAVIALRYSEMFSQGKRNDIIAELELLSSGKKQNSREKVGEEYGLSRNTIARLLRVDKLINEIKEWVDNGLVSVRAAVELSYLDNAAQDALYSLNKDGKKLLFKITEKKAKQLRAELPPGTEKPRNIIYKILLGEKVSSQDKKLKLDKKLYDRYFDGMDETEITDILEKALEMYYNTKEKD